MNASAPLLGPAELFEGELALGIEEAVAFATSSWRSRSPCTSTVLVQLPAPVAPSLALLATAGTSMGFLWDPAQGDLELAGSGATRLIELVGPGRPAALRQRAEELFAGIETFSFPGVVAPTPRFFGGLAFERGGAAEPFWREFGDGSFVLPRLLYARGGGQASLSLALAAEHGCDEAALAGELGAVFAALASPNPPARQLPAALTFDQLPQEKWAGQVEAIRAAIASGRFEKIVAARRSELQFAAAPDPLAILVRLCGAGVAGCRRFAFFRGHACFLGATPERLIRRHGRTIETEALAGSIGGGREQGLRLLGSKKDRGEHALVVEHVAECLGPLCERLEHPPEPRIRELRNLLHLHTPFTGRLATDHHVLELVAALHPTPAVGGVPAAPATRWIADHEAAPRGWYAGPVGWFDAAGDGEFDVALRTCLLTGSRALLYAGAGIMLDSDPELEYQETDLKQRSLLAALGVGE